MIGIKCNMSIKSQNRDINQTIHSSLMGQAKIHAREQFQELEQEKVN